MTTAATATARPGWRRALGVGAAAPVAPRTLRALVHMITDLFAALCTSSVIIALAVLTAVTLPIVPLSILLFALLLFVSWVAGHVERFRIAATTGVVLWSPHRRHPGALPSRLWRWLRSAATWKELGYHLVHLPKAVVTSAIVLGAWSLGLALLAMPLYLARVPSEEARLLYWRIHPGAEALLAASLGLLILLVAPWVTRGLSRLSLGMAEGLLSGGEAEVLRQRVATVEASRAEVVDAAEAERRRIERDLHDGAQQRLVALAMSLGLAKEKLDSDPVAARALVDEAHREAKNALVELRDLARGLHPPVLTDRGLHAAIAGLASRAPIPVEVDLRVSRRAPPSIEGIAYFVISESLTNVARHSGARRARAVVVDEGSRLVVEVSDDGIGGASADRGTGLRGLADRIRAVDGTFRVTSPTGGPTTVRAELPLPAALAAAPSDRTPPTPSPPPPPAPAAPPSPPSPAAPAAPPPPPAPPAPPGSGDDPTTPLGDPTAVQPSPGAP